MRLCLELGCTLQELGQRMTAEEFGLWATRYSREPFGELRADLQAGVIAATVANMAGRVRSDQAGAAMPSHFIPKWRLTDEPPEAPPEVDPMTFFSAIGKT